MWILLGTFGYFWVLLGTFEYFWGLLGTFGYLLVPLGTFQYFSVLSVLLGSGTCQEMSGIGQEMSRNGQEMSRNGLKLLRYCLKLTNKQRRGKVLFVYIQPERRRREGLQQKKETLNHPPYFYGSIFFLCSFLFFLFKSFHMAR